MAIFASFRNTLLLPDYWKPYLNTTSILHPRQHCRHVNFIHTACVTNYSREVGTTRLQHFVEKYDHPVVLA